MQLIHFLEIAQRRPRIYQTFLKEEENQRRKKSTALYAEKYFFSHEKFQNENFRLNLLGSQVAQFRLE